ncbi:MAG: glutamate racemase [Nitrospira sp.]
MKSGKKQRAVSIGVFDSGFGGINILRSMVKKLPDYNYVYLGDTARVPYGSRTDETIYEFTRQGMDFLFSQGCEVIVIACNTASATALRKIQQEYLPKKHPNKKVLGVLIPAVESAGLETKNNRVGVIATETTVRSNAFKIELNKINSKIKVFQKACPLLVPIVESGEEKSKTTETILRNYLTPLLAKGIDTLVLGCTHYGILEKTIKKIVGPKVHVVSGAKIVPEKLKLYLKNHAEIEIKISKESSVEFYSTDLNNGFERLGGKFFGSKIKANKAVVVDNYLTIL